MAGFECRPELRTREPFSTGKHKGLGGELGSAYAAARLEDFSP